MDEKEYFRKTVELKSDNRPRLWGSRLRKKIVQFSIMNVKSVGDVRYSECETMKWQVLDNTITKKRKFNLAYFIQPFVYDSGREMMDLTLPFSRESLYEIYNTRMQNKNWVKILITQDIKMKHGIHFNGLYGAATNCIPFSYRQKATVEQLELYNLISIFFSSNRETFKLLAILGRAGTGKSFTLGIISECLPEEIKIYDTCYITIKGDLVKIIMDEYPEICGLVACQVYLNLFNMNFYRHYLKFNNIILRQSFENIDAVISRMTRDDFYIDAFKKYSNLTTDNWCIYIDEFSMFSASELYFLKGVFQKITTLFPIKIALIFAGDPKQIPPIVNIHEDNAREITNMVDDVIEYKSQMRNDNEEYTSFIESIAKMTDVVEARKKIANYFKHLLPIYPISVEYPTDMYENYPHVHLLPLTPDDERQMEGIFAPFNECIFNQLSEGYFQPISLDLETGVSYRKPPIAWYHNKIENLDSLMTWWRTFKVKINNFVVLTKTNREVHRLNISLFLEMLSNIKTEVTRLGLSDENIKKMFSYSYILFKNEQQKYVIEYHKEDYIPICPLIVGATYTLCTTIGPFRRGECLNLLFFDRDQQMALLVDGKEQLLVLSPQEFKHALFTKDCEHYSNITGGINVQNPIIYGFPIQLSFAKNIFSSQGTTIPRHISILLDIQNCDIFESYVALSRCKNKNQIKQILC
ncbi:MAG: hypothetical protein ACRYGG_20295 [Janthinobacterium lividum]